MPVIFIFTECRMCHYADDSCVYDDGTMQNVKFYIVFGPLHMKVQVIFKDLDAVVKYNCITSERLSNYCSAGSKSPRKWPDLRSGVKQQTVLLETQLLLNFLQSEGTPSKAHLCSFSIHT